VRAWTPPRPGRPAHPPGRAAEGHRHPGPPACRSCCRWARCCSSDRAARHDQRLLLHRHAQRTRRRAVRDRRAPPLPPRLRPRRHDHREHRRRRGDPAGAEPTFPPGVADPTVAETVAGVLPYVGRARSSRSALDEAVVAARRGITDDRMTVDGGFVSRSDWCRSWSTVANSVTSTIGVGCGGDCRSIAFFGRPASK
jgi:hypothetical protein